MPVLVNTNEIHSKFIGINYTSGSQPGSTWTPRVHVILVTRGPPISRWQEQAKAIVLMSNSYEGVHQEKKKRKGSKGKKG